MINKWPIRYQLSLFLFILVCTPLIIGTISQGYYLKKIYVSESNQKLAFAYETWQEQLQLYEQSMRDYGLQIADNAPVISGINLISKYQNSEDYRPDIFDAAKVKLNDVLAGLFQLTDMTALGLYTAEGHLVSSVSRWQNGPIRSIVTYQEKKPVSLTYDNSLAFVQESGGLSSGLNYRIPLDGQSPESVVKRIDQDFYLESVISIERDYTDGHKETVGYLLLRKKLDQKVFNLVSSLTGVPFSLYFDGKWIGGIDLGAASGTLAQFLKTRSVRDEIAFYREHDKFYLQIAPMVLADGSQAFVISGVDKSLLNTWITIEYRIASVSAIITLLTCLAIGLFWARRIVTRPITELVAGVERVQGGDYVDKVQLDGAREFVSLADSVNEMSERILEREERLVNATKRWQQIFDSISDIILVIDRQLRVINANRAAELFFDLSVEELTGECCHELFFLGKEKHEVDSPAAITLNDSATHTAEIHCPHLSDKVILISTSPVFGRDGMIENIIYTGKDITETKNLQERLQQAQKMEALGTLAGGIAHDFNNILSPILGYSELLERRLPQSSHEHNQVEMIVTAALRARGLVKQILGFSRKEKEEAQPLLLAGLIKETTKLLRSSLPSNIEIQLDIDEECGPVLADATNIHQILLNLCTNSAHAMQENGGLLTLSLAEVTDRFQGESERRYAKLTVADNGSGMPADILRRATEPYFTTKKQGEGSGLGLSIVHSIVTAAAGQMVIDSEQDQGTKIEVYLPIYSYSASSGHEQRSESALVGEQETVLLVDDEQIVLDVTQQMLKELGYRSIAESSPLDALRTFEESSATIDLVMTDIMMPDMNGIELAGKIRALDSSTPIIFTSGVSNHFNKEELKSIGHTSCLLKPVNYVQLSVSLREMLNKDVKEG